jgi:RHH-type proline utilization regulon transcriptional repressor/proline dehydrogenase/delta 1-pyrroline-5-carboxylate dehydrogenase
VIRGARHPRSRARGLRPVLHVATFAPKARCGSSRDQRHRLRPDLRPSHPDRHRVQHVAERVRAGNVYVNRNQIGAVVGSQPFGGEGLSGTGPKAGGPDYLTRFRAAVEAEGGVAVTAPDLAPKALEEMPEIGGALYWGDAATARAYSKALARRAGPILPLVTGGPTATDVFIERHLCIDTTASGGNAELLAQASAGA